MIDASRFPLHPQSEAAHRCRRLGLGVTGLADALAMLGQPYNSDRGRQTAASVMETLRNAAYLASTGLAREKGPFPLFDRDRYLASPNLDNLPRELRREIAENGIRNSHLTTIAPCGTTSLLADNISSGIEPIFSFSARRRVRRADAGWEEYDLEDRAYAQWIEQHGAAPLPTYFQCVDDLEPMDHLAMQAVLQPFVDNAISKTINVPEETGFERFKDIYHRAYRMGLKGCTTYRPNPVTGAVLSNESADPDSHCCTPDREAD